MIEGARRANGNFGEARRFGRSVGIESRSFDVSSAGPESGADYFVGIGFAGDRICSVALRCAPPGEPRHCEIKTAPEKVNWTVFANEARTKLLENPIHCNQCSPEPNDGVAI